MIPLLFTCVPEVLGKLAHYGLLCELTPFFLHTLCGNAFRTHPLHTHLPHTAQSACPQVLGKLAHDSLLCMLPFFLLTLCGMAIRTHPLYSHLSHTAQSACPQVLGKLAHYSLLYALPFFLHGPVAMLSGAAAYVVIHSIVLAATFAGVCGCACVRVWCACVRVWVCVCAAAYVVIHSIVLPATLAGV